MDPLYVALLLAAIFTVLLAVIEVHAASEVPLRACVSSGLVAYVLVLLNGNVATTIGAAAVISGSVGSSPTGAEGEGAGGWLAFFQRQLPWFWYAFVGVFGFEVILTRINLTFSDQNVLTISDWISRARSVAVAAAVKKQAALQEQQHQELARQLAQLPEETLSTHVGRLLSPDQRASLNDTIQKYGDTMDTTLLKALTLSYEAYDQARHIGA